MSLAASAPKQLKEAALAGEHVNPAADTHTFRILAWLGVILQAAALVFVVISQRWGGVPSIGVFFVLSLLFLLMREHVQSLISFLVVMAAIANAGGWAWEWFHLVWFDEFVHAFSSLAVVAALLCMAWGLGWLTHPGSTGRVVLMAMALGLGLGILWEIMEATFVSLTLIDTISDVILDVIGAAVGGLLADWAMQGRRYQLRA